ncbi:MAG: F0F1 ATP synthase subunit epsilon [candidate division Zixibacteria bacterium]|jgi:F-type H+-transporting ATPase subunit epsilon|nr:F0F1 ATP synthase subunit epsilon [candidate division Zixibacteria bacterium]
MFKLSVVSPERVLYEQEVQGIVVPGSEGYLGVLSNHAPLISSLAPGKITITESDEKQRIAAVSGGFIEVSDNVATILAETVEFVEEIDLDRARTAYERAKERIGMKKSGIDMQRALAALRRAENRLKIAEGKAP